MPGELYGLGNSNRTGSDLWGKNQFNSTFPMALCSYMRDDGRKPVYISIENSGQFVATDDRVSFEQVFGTSDTNVRFDFETDFEPIRGLFADENTQSIDVVTSSAIEGRREQLRALEVKLTVLPDESTSRRPESEWSSELVIRPVTSAYAMLVVWNRLPLDRKRSLRALVREFITGRYKVQDWDNKNEVLGISREIHRTLFEVSLICCDYQEPFLVQPLWKTLGKSPELADNCFEVFVWSDLATVMLPYDLSENIVSLPLNKRKTTRHLREVVRHICCISKLARDEFVYEEVYGGMGFGLQTDKSFSISGSNTIKYMRHARLKTPTLRADILPHVIMGGGEKNLSPERRFDATIYFAARSATST